MQNDGSARDRDNEKVLSTLLDLRAVNLFTFDVRSLVPLGGGWNNQYVVSEVEEMRAKKWTIASPADSATL